MTNNQIGYGYNTSIYANISDLVGLDEIYINVTGLNGTNFYEEMVHETGSNYSYFFNDSWHLELYTFIITASNTNGVITLS